jgi:antitoxin CcdA
MHAVRDDRRAAGKKPVNLSLDAELLNEARQHGINLSATLEHALQEELRKVRRERWLADNAAAIAAYNQQVDEHGVFSDGLRSF